MADLNSLVDAVVAEVDMSGPRGVQFVRLVLDRTSWVETANRILAVSHAYQERRIVPQLRTGEEDEGVSWVTPANLDQSLGEVVTIQCVIPMNEDIWRSMI